MATGGVFRIITSDGKMDQLTMATDMLKRRICEIIDIRTQMKMESVLPTIKDLEKTHVLHFQNKFKPFVAIGFEYQKIRPQAGTSQLSGTSTTQFSITQFGDFLSDAVFRLQLSSCSFATGTVPALGAAYAFVNINSTITSGASPIVASSASAGNNVLIYYPDGVTGVRMLESVTEEGVAVTYVTRLRYLDGAGTVPAAATPGTITANTTVYMDANGRYLNAVGTAVADRIFYCDFPGERILKKTEFQVAGNPIDQYDSYSYAWYRKFRVMVDKQVGYFRNMGQEQSRHQVSELVRDGVRLQRLYLNGLQTPAASQPSTVLWPKLLFWNNLNHADSLVSAAIPYGQRFINVDLEAATNLVFRAPAVYQTMVLQRDRHLTSTLPNLTLNATTLTWSVSASVTAGEVAILNGTTAGSLGTTASVLLYPVFTNGAMNAPTVQAFDLYYNNIFTIPEVHDIYIERIGFSLIRVRRIQSTHVNTTTIEPQMSQFKYPIEYFYAGMIPDNNTAAAPSSVASTSAIIAASVGYTQNPTDWHRFSYRTRTVSTATTGKALSYVGGAALQFNEQYYQWSDQATIDQLTVSIHSIPLYNQIERQFFNAYMPESYGAFIRTPDDEGALFINFALHPGRSQPSGHVNSSRAKFIGSVDIQSIGKFT